MKIQEYSDRYLNAVGALIVTIQREEFGVPISLSDQPDLADIRSFYQKGNGNFWIALENEDVVGTIALIDIGNSQIALRKMFVSRKFRGAPHFCGQRLLDTALEWMKLKKCTEVFLGTLDVFEAAQRFYARNGFTEIPMASLPPAFPRMKLDTRFFRKQVSFSDINGISMLDYKAEHQPWFEKLNRNWIEKYFWMEPLDFEILQHPDEHIIDKGGAILMATYNGEIAGTVALKFVTTGVYEFTKMAVDEKFQGKKIGLALAERAIEKGKSLGGKKIILYSNTILGPAISLYKKIGFKEIPVDGPYKRSNIKMELIL